MVNILTNELMFFSSWMGSVPCAVSQLGRRAPGETPCGLAETRNNLLSVFLNSYFTKAQTSGKMRDFTEIYRGLPWWLRSKESTRQAGDIGLIPGSGRPPGEGNGNPRQYSCLGNPMDRGAWWATVRGVAKGQTRLSN